MKLWMDFLRLWNKEGIVSSWKVYKKVGYFCVESLIKRTPLDLFFNLLRFPYHFQKLIPGWSGITYVRVPYRMCSIWGTLISPNCLNFVEAPISPNFKMKEAPISPNFQNRKHFDLFFYILSCKNTASNSNLLFEFNPAGCNTFESVF